MDKPNQLNQDRVRQIVRDYLTAMGLSASALAQQAHLNRSILSRWLAGQAEMSAGSALKLYMAIENRLALQGRRTFIQECGLPDVLLRALESESVGYSATLCVSLDPQTAGHRLMVLAHQTCNRSWKEAVPIFQAAESAFGPASSAAAMAACYLSQVYTNLGDYGRAQQEFDRLQRGYEAVMDPQTQASVYESLGMLHYYLGAYPKAEMWLQCCLKLAEDWGLARQIRNVQHFLGRVYTAWGLTLSMARDARAGEMFHRAHMRLEIAHCAHAEIGDDTGLAYDLLREAQLLRAQNQGLAANRLLKGAHQAFGNDALASCHTELEEAELAQENGEVRVSSIKAGHALEVFSAIAYAKGIADALRIQGVSEQLMGRPDRALAWYVASLCVFPNAQSPSICGLMADTAALRDSLRAERGSQSYRRLVGRLREMIENRQDEFACLSHVGVDRNADIARVLAMLEQGTDTSRPSRP